MDTARNMEIGCVAEGVETAETANLLEHLGVSDLQGYLIGRPMPVNAVGQWLASWTQPATITQNNDTRVGMVPTTRDAREISPLAT
jgi:predicted signal transduction protein with EAL and GGDEF domain